MCFCVRPASLFKLELSSDISLTHSYLKIQTDSANPDLVPRVASDQGLHCLLTVFSIKNRIKVIK